MQQPYLVLGIDPGIASCGFCLLDTANNRILEMGAHLFDAPQEDKTRVSLATTRRNARSTRRNIKRRSDRQKHCLGLLAEYGLVPQDAPKGWLQSRKGDAPVLSLRAKALDELITDRELAQILYSLSAHRGYIPHGEGSLTGEGDVDAETGKVLRAIGANTKALSEGGWRTIGEMLNDQKRSRNKRGAYDLCVLNSQIVDEVHQVMHAQRTYGNTRASSELEERYLKVLTWEKPSLGHDEKVYNLVGSCSYFPEERRAANATLSSELCRAYERLGHLVIVNPDGSERVLSDHEREELLSILFAVKAIKGNKECKVTYANIRKMLDLGAECFFKGVDQDDEKKREPYEPRAWRNMRSHGVPSTLLERMLSDRDFADKIGEALTFASTEESLQMRLESLDLTDEEYESIAALPFNSKVYKGYGSRSLKALSLLLDAFQEEGIQTLTDAEEASGLLSRRLAKGEERTTQLPTYDVFDPTCNNPVVLRTLSRMRRIVNAIIRIHGVPNEIHVELGRELKQSNKEKAAIQKNNAANERDRKRWAGTLAEVMSISPDEVPNKLIRKCIMREEQGERDPYTGDPIELQCLIDDDRYCEIDHILPYSRTCDDSRRNKVLVLSKSNQDKRERTPYEWMTSGEVNAPSWDEFQKRVLNSKALLRKRGYLLNQSLGVDEETKFLQRNLNDMRYMSRAVKNWLEKSLALPEGGRVVAVAGGATANLRHVWGLNTGPNNKKDRSDDRHHAIDAAVIAACSQGTLMKVAKARALGAKAFRRMRESRLSDTQPWPTFASEVLAQAEFIIPTRMVNHGLTGRAFEDTAYRYVGESDDANRRGVLYAKGKEVKKGNFQIGADGNARIVDGMAFLRLWLDVEGNAGKGKWYAEPVYYADIPHIMNGDYVARVAPKAHVGRTLGWIELPESARTTAPITVFRNDALVVESQIVRYTGFHVGSVAIEYEMIGPAVAQVTIPSLGKWDSNTRVRVLEEDCLGHCYREFGYNMPQNSLDDEC